MYTVERVAGGMCGVTEGRLRLEERSDRLTALGWDAGQPLDAARTRPARSGPRDHLASG